MREDYYDIDAILAQDEVVPCVFNTGACKLGFLDNTSEGDDLEKDSHVELPFWLVAVLGDRNFITVQTPKHYKQKFRTHLLADPSVVNLRDRSQYYYTVGIRLAKFFEPDEAEKVFFTLVKALSVRYRSILDRCLNSRNEDNTTFTNSLTLIEKFIFYSGYRSSVELYDWRTRQAQKLKSFRPRKRKREMM